MRLNFDIPTNIGKLVQYDSGIKPRYAKKGSTLRGDAWCPNCSCCVGSLIYWERKDLIVGFAETCCTLCGKGIDWSDARENL